jgi:small ligand-binding sensory domain FIST
MYMTVLGSAAQSAFMAGADWKSGLTAILPDLAAVRPNLLFCFAAQQFSADFPAILAALRAETGAEIVAGCSTTAVIGNDRELERMPALSCLALALPGAEITPVRLPPEALLAPLDPPELRAAAGAPLDAGGLFLFADLRSVDDVSLMAMLRAAYPDVPIIGGMASAGPRDRQIWLMLNDQVLAGGAVGVALGGYDVVPVVSQGCTPIGETWTITGVANGWIESIGNRPAIEIMLETVNGLDPESRANASRNLLFGLAADEHRQDYQRGDFLIRAINGFDQARGAIAIEGGARAGQTAQFQLRDAATADLDLSLALNHAKTWLDGRRPIGGVLCTSESRGASLFGSSHHDALTVAKSLGSPMVAGCFSAAEFGPVGLAPLSHRGAAVLGLICERSR